MERELKIGAMYQHFKGKQYKVLAIAEHTETSENLVIYQALYGEGKIYARPYQMFLEEVDHEKYPESTQKRRFQEITSYKC